MLEGKNIDLKIVEKEDLPLVAQWRNNPEFQGEYNLLIQESETELEKRYNNFSLEEQWFLIQKKDGGKIGLIGLEPMDGILEIGYCILQGGRGKGCCIPFFNHLTNILMMSH